MKISVIKKHFTYFNFNLVNKIEELVNFQKTKYELQRMHEIIKEPYVKITSVMKKYARIVRLPVKIYIDY